MPGRSIWVRRIAWCGLFLFSIVVIAYCAGMFSTHRYRLYGWEVWRFTGRAQNGDVEAINRLRLHYEFLGNKEKTLYWLRQGASRGDPESQLVLFDRLKSRPEPSLQKEAKENLERAAEQGYASAQMEIAIQHIEGTLYPHSNEQAEKLFREAACNGSVDAMRRLSMLLTDTHADQGSLTEAFMWTLIGLARSPHGYERYFEEQQKAIIRKAARVGIPAPRIEEAARVNGVEAEKLVRTDTSAKPPFGIRR